MNETGKKILFIHEGMITPTIVRMYLIDELLSAGFDVELYSLRFVRSLFNELPDEVDSDIYHRLDSFDDFKKILNDRDVTKTIILSSVADNFMSRRVYSFLQKNHFLYVYINPYGNVMGKGKLSLHEKIQLAFSSNILKKIMPKLKTIYNNKVYNPLHHIDFEKHVLASTKPREVAINSNDYEVYLELEQQNERIVVGQYILFIDIFFPLHPELPYYFGNQEVSSEPYLNSINHFFDFIEEKYKLPVVVALHPKSKYSDADFGGRRTYKYKTHSLIKDAEIVLNHVSTSTTLAILYNKPTLYFYMQCMLDFYPKYIRKLIWSAESVGKEAINIDAIDLKTLNISTFDDAYRDHFIYNFMTTKENENKSNKEIIVTLLNDLFLKLENGEKTPFNS